MNKSEIKARVMIIAGAALWMGATTIVCAEETISLGENSGRSDYRAQAKAPRDHSGYVHHSHDSGAGGDLISNSSFEQTLTSDGWRVENGYLNTPSAGTKPVQLAFGDDDWRNYEFSLQACATGGMGELLIGVRCNFRKSYALVLGADGNSRHKLLRVVNNRKTRKKDVTVIESKEGYINHGRSHRIRIRCDGSRLQAWVDDELLFDLTDEDGPASGRLSVGVRNGQARFRNFKAVTLDGKALYHGPPTPAQHWHAVGRGKIVLDSNEPLNRSRSIKMVSHTGRTGIEQDYLSVGKGLWRCTLWIRGEAPDGLLVALLDGNNALVEAKLAPPTSDWRGVPIDLPLDRAVKNAHLRIQTQGKATVWVDQIQLVPDSSHPTHRLAQAWEIDMLPRPY